MPLDYLWKRCMEFVRGNSTGKLQKHFVDLEKGTVHKVDIFLFKLKRKQLNVLTITIASRKITSHNNHSNNINFKIDEATKKRTDNNIALPLVL